MLAWLRNAATDDDDDVGRQHRSFARLLHPPELVGSFVWATLHKSPAAARRSTSVGRRGRRQPVFLGELGLSIARRINRATVAVMTGGGPRAERDRK